MALVGCGATDIPAEFPTLDGTDQTRAAWLEDGMAREGEKADGCRVADPRMGTLPNFVTTTGGDGDWIDIHLDGFEPQTQSFEDVVDTESWLVRWNTVDGELSGIFRDNPEVLITIEGTGSGGLLGTDVVWGRFEGTACDSVDRRTCLTLTEGVFAATVTRSCR